MKRFACLEALASLVGNRVVVTNIGPTRSEWEKVRPGDANLYQAQLGTLTAISLGLAIALSKTKSDLGVVALDGDGNLLFAPGVLATVAHAAPPGLVIFVFDNGCYESTGAQPSVTARGTDLEQVAKAFGLKAATTVSTLESFIDAAGKAFNSPGPQLIVARVEPSAGRQEFLASVQPSTLDGIENKYRLARYIEGQAGVQVLHGPDYATGFSPSVGRN
jgi:thiamine pyrophosphate-dependent acetolactate synthase large subunit-like protein